MRSVTICNNNQIPVVVNLKRLHGDSRRSCRKLRFSSDILFLFPGSKWRIRSFALFSAFETWAARCGMATIECSKSDTLRQGAPGYGEGGL